MDWMLSRRRLLKLAALAPCPAIAYGQADPSAWVEVQTGRRSMRALVRPADGATLGVVVLSHGMGGTPGNYSLLNEALSRAGFAVIAPLHVDSMQHPGREKYSLRETFGERIADVNAACSDAKSRWGDLPVACVGHSYGSLISFCLAGALAYVANFRRPEVAAVVAFSSPGVIPGLVVRERAYVSVQVPCLTITGDRDVVLDMVADWQDHLLAFRSAPPSTQTALVLEKANHSVVVDKGELGSTVRGACIAFLQTKLLGRAGAFEAAAQAINGSGRGKVVLRDPA